MDEKFRVNFYKRLAARIINPNDFDKIAIEISRDMEKRGINIRELPEFAGAVGNAIQDSFVGKTCEEPIQDWTYLTGMMYVFLVYQYFGLAYTIQEDFADDLLKLLYSKTYNIAVERGLLDENGNLKE